MRRWHIAILALCLLATVFALLLWRTTSNLSGYDSWTIRFVDESTGEAVSNLTVSISESPWDRIHDLLEDVGLAGSNTKQQEQTCSNGILSNVHIPRDKKAWTSVICTGGGHEAALLVYWHGTWRGTNRPDNLTNSVPSISDYPALLCTNRILTIPLAP
ncbi:MAG TPA: hypothetical protein VKM56_00495 [Verrucomicrobiae bacterium]|nr:hypothetical protein [Verrucomicrobiae bacterium]